MREFGISFMYTIFWKSADLPEFPELLGKANTNMVLSPAENRSILFPVSHLLIAQFGNGYQTHAIFLIWNSL